MNMKRLFSTILAFCLFQTSLTAFAQETPQQETPVPSVMTADEAVAYAMEHSPALAAAKADVTNSQYSKYLAANTYDQYSNSSYADYSTTTLETGLTVTGYYARAAAKQLEIAQRNLETQTYALKTDVLNKFYSYINTKNKTALAKTNLTSTKEKCNFAKTRLESGMITAIDYSNFELAVFAGENSVKKAERDEETALRALKDTLNFPVNQELSVTGTFSENEPFYETPEKAAELSRTQNTYLNLYDAFKLAEEKWNFASEYYFPSQHQYKIEQAAYTAAAANFEQNTRSLDSSIYSGYNNLMTLKDNIEYLKKNIELLTVNTEAAYLRYEMGTITANDYFDAEQKLFSAKNDLIDLQLSYYIGIQNYKSIYTLDNSEENK